MTKEIFTEKTFSDFKQCEVWRCGVRLDNGKKYARKDIQEPVKAWHYMLMLARKEFVPINEESKKLIKEAIDQSNNK